MRPFAPLESAIRTLPTRQSIVTVSGRGQLQILGTDALGVVVLVGPTERIATLPWAAIEGSMAVLQTGHSVPLRSWPPSPEHPRSLSDVSLRWTRYPEAASWIAALLRAAGVLSVEGRRAPTVQLVPNSIPELERWNANLLSLTSQQLDALGMELKTATFYTIEGLRELARVNRRYDFYAPSFQVLGAGYEHLLKLTLTLGLLHVDGELPSRSDIRRTYGHDLIKLRDAVVAVLAGVPWAPSSQVSY